MQYQDLIDHLQDEGCYPDEAGAFEHGTFYHNCINGFLCYVHRIESFSSVTACHIFFELKINPHPDLEDYYEVFKLFRDEHQKRMETLQKDK